jgi:outer membrane biosynthesis protein TonB
VALHGLLLLLAAWLLAVMPSLDSGRFAREEPIPHSQTAAEAKESAADVTIVFVPSTELPKPKPPPEKPAKAKAPASGGNTVMAPEDQPVLAPLNLSTPFISSRNMRASTTSAAAPGADPNRLNQDGHEDAQNTSLADRNFIPGSEAAPSPPAAEAPSPPEPAMDPVTAQTPPPPTPPPPTPPPPGADRPPDAPAATVTSDPTLPAPASGKAPGESIALRERPPETIPLTPAPPPPPAPAPPKPQPHPTEPSLTSAARRSNGQKPQISSVKSKSIGAISNKGDTNSVDARETPEGRYNSTVHQRIGLLWNSRLATIRGLAGIGTVEVDFEIDVTGRISNVRLADPGKASPVFEDVCLTAIIKAKLPPPPEEMLRELRDPLSNGRLRRRFTFHRL